LCYFSEVTKEKGGERGRDDERIIGKK